MELKSDKESRVVVDPLYADGRYFAAPGRHSEDAAFKAEKFLRLFLKLTGTHQIQVSSYADVGCGSGDVVQVVATGLKKAGFNLREVKGYDISPHVEKIKHVGVEFIHGDFCSATEHVDLVTLFDVFEHVLDPILFLKQIAERCNVVGFIIPLDDCLNTAMRDMYRAKLTDPGHLIFLDCASALNILAQSGFKVIDYEYIFGALAPSGHRTLLQKVGLPLRLLLSKLSPWLTSKTVGGASLSVVALTPRGLGWASRNPV